MKSSLNLPLAERLMTPLRFRPLRRRACCGLEFAVLVAFAMFAPGMAQAAVPPADDLAAEQMSVRELMRLDTELALNHAKRSLRKGEGVGSDGSGQYARSGVLKLIAIYGVGKKLLAEVTVGTQPYVYMHGQALPVGVKADASAYMLRGISGSCVQLERNDEAHTLCLYPSSWTAQ